MGWLLAFLGYVALLALACRWWYLWGIAKGRLLERIERAEQRHGSLLHREPERHLYVVRGERWHDDGPGAA